MGALNWRVISFDSSMSTSSSGIDGSGSRARGACGAGGNGGTAGALGMRCVRESATRPIGALLLRLPLQLPLMLWIWCVMTR